MVHNSSIKFSTQTQIVPYLRDLKEESRSLLEVSENGTLLMIEPTIMNNQNDSSIASELNLQRVPSLDHIRAMHMYLQGSITATFQPAAIHLYAIVEAAAPVPITTRSKLLESSIYHHLISQEDYTEISH